jgi:hypothetical protein
MSREHQMHGEKSIAEQVQSALTWLKQHSSKAVRDGMARYAIPSSRRRSDSRPRTIARHNGSAGTRCAT